MSDTPRDRLAAALADRYELARELGAGGMATVYLARDVRHDRDVAIKVLHPDLGAAIGGERFLAEIKTTARLQHPHILPLLDSGAADGLLYYVMPYVRGETLRAQIERDQQLAIDDAVRVAREVADALEHAHAQGIVHRDIKPENILLQDGHALVADFGIALAVQTAGGARLTQTGLSLGTPQYMAPEQAVGDKAVGPRADLYALGAVTYEMLTGEPPHTGASAQAIVAKLLTDTVRPLTMLRPNVPPAVDAAVRRALEKLPADRFASARAFAQALATPLASTAAATAMPSAGGRPARWIRFVPWLVALASLLVALARWQSTPDAGAASAPVVRLPIPLAPTENPSFAIQGGLAISPDGQRLAYLVQDENGSRVMLRQTADLTPRVIIDHEVKDLLFSRDGSRLLYRDGFELRQLPLSGGDARRVTTLASGIQYNGLTWGNGDTLLLGSTRWVAAIATETGSLRIITPPDRRLTGRHPVLLPDRQTIVISMSDSALGPSGTLATVSLASGEIRVLPYPRLVPIAVLENTLLALDPDSSTMLALPAEAKALTTARAPVVLADNIMGDRANGPQAVVSASGTLLVLQGALLNEVVIRQTSGAEATLALPADAYLQPRFSPDGSRILLQTRRGRLLTYTRGSGAITPLGDAYRGDWMADGQRIVFMGSPNRSVFQTRRADGTGPIDTLMQDRDAAESILSPNAQWIVFRTPAARAAPNDLFAVRPRDTAAPVPVASGPSVELSAAISSDSKWLAYVSDASGRFEVYVRPFPADGPRITISQDGGAAPFWSKQGRTLYYRRGTTLLAADLGADGTIAPTRRTILDLKSVNANLGSESNRAYDVSAGEREVVFTRRVPGDTKIVLVHNWIRELHERVNSGSR
ncbi:MAG: protein kinase [Gemmatimonadaceae bacterium]|nr:protein kinase [Gemmatimonadaceae bacterium]